MGTLYLVRHGQASFGAADYDQLSPLGRRQCLMLGEHFRRRGRRFEAVFTGRLKRHAQSLAAIVAGLRGAPSPEVLPALDEYDGTALVMGVHPEPLDPPDTPERYREHFRLLRQGLSAWMKGDLTPPSMPAYTDFVAGIDSVLERVRTGHEGDVLVVSSGGPISTAVGRVLGTTPATTIDLNMRLRNSSVTEFGQTFNRHMLLTFNTVPHLEAVDDTSLVTWT